MNTGVNTNAGLQGKHAGVRYDYIPANTPSVLNAKIVDAQTTIQHICLSQQLTPYRIKWQASGVVSFTYTFGHIPRL